MYLFKSQLLASKNTFAIEQQSLRFYFLAAIKDEKACLLYATPFVIESIKTSAVKTSKHMKHLSRSGHNVCQI